LFELLPLWYAFNSCGGVGRMHNFNACVTGKSGFVESEDGGEAVHLHGGHQPGVVGGLPGNLILNDQVFPNLVNLRRIWQYGEHLF
jgi:hypothetical protein